MARVQFSEELVSTLDLLSETDKEQFHALLIDLAQSLSPGLSVEEQIRTFLRQSPALLLSEELKRQLPHVLPELHYSRIRLESDDTFVRELVEAWQERNGRESSSQQLAELEQVLSAILRVDALRTSMKGISLMADHERLFLDSRILTDIRPIFDDDKNALPSGAVITHTMKINMYVDGKQVSMYVVLDGDDLHKLKSVLDRAIQKEQQLSTLTASVLGPRFPSTVDTERGN